MNLNICKKKNDGKFIVLKFVKSELEESFNLNYNDLFYIKGNNVYFLIVFNYLYIILIVK